MAVDLCNDLDAANTAEQAAQTPRVRKLSLAIAIRSTAEGSDTVGSRSDGMTVVALPAIDIRLQWRRTAFYLAILISRPRRGPG